MNTIDINALGVGHKLCTGDKTEFLTDVKETAIKVGLYVVGVLAKVADFVTNIIPPIGLCKLYNHYYNQPLNDEINKAQLDNYRRGLTQEMSTANIIQGIDTPQFKIQKINSIIINEKPQKRKDLIKYNKEADKFNFEFNNILKKIIMSEDEENGIQAEDIRNAINDIIQSNIYQESKLNNDQFCIRTLKLLAYAGTAADGTEAIKNYGEKVRGASASADQTTNELANSLNEMNSNSLCFNRNGSLSKPWWATNHLQTLVHLGVSNYDPLAFEAEKGNLPFRAGTINVPGSNPIPSTFGPTPTDPIYFDAILPYLDENGKTEVRFILQNTKGAEGKRVAEFYKKTKDFRESGALSLITLPFDMQPMKDPVSFMGKNVFKNNFSINGFMTTYSNFITENCRNENIFNDDTIVPIIPKEILSNDDLADCFNFTTNVFSNIFDLTNLNQLSEKEKIEIATTMQLFTQSIMIVTALSKISKGKRKIASLSIACKQCVDRAVALISAVVLLNEISSTENSNAKSIYSNDPMTDFKNRVIDGINSPPNLSNDTSNFIHGIIMGRAQIVDQRLIMANRFKILMDFMGILFGGEKNISHISENETDSPHIQ